MINTAVLMLAFFCGLFSYVFPVIVGSNSAVSRQAFTTFPAVDTNNRLLGFAVFNGGFRLESARTNCTFDALFPLNGSVVLAGGSFTLAQDMTIYNNANTFIGGSITANNHAVKLRTNTPRYTTACGELSLITETPGDLAVDPNTADFSRDSRFFAIGTQSTGADGEVVIYSFNGITYTRVASAELGANVVQVAWHPSGDFLAVATASRGGNDLVIYSFNKTTFALTATGGFDFGSAVGAIAWHPSGGAIVADRANTTNSIRLFSFSAGTITSIQTINLLVNITPADHTISWSPGGNFVAFGYVSRVGVELEVYSFNGATLTSSASLEIGQTVTALDWSPTGTYIGVGLSGSTTRFRVYEHNAAGGTLTLVASAPEAATVASVDWNQTGDCLVIGTGGATATLNSYYFDKTAATLTFMGSLTASGSYRFSTRSYDDNYVALLAGNAGDRTAYTYSTGNADAYFGVPSDFSLSNGALEINQNFDFKGRMFFNGDCRLDCRDYTIKLVDSGGLFVRPGAQLIIQNATIEGITEDNFSCITDAGDITLRNVNLRLTSNYTFSKGAILFEQDTLITDDRNARTFTFSPSRTSTISSYSQLIVDDGVTLSYAPSIPNKNLISMTDETSTLYLNGATLLTTSTSLNLDMGNVILDNHVTISCGGNNTGEALEFGTNLTVNLLGDSFIDLYGPIKSL